MELKFVAFKFLNVDFVDRDAAEVCFETERVQFETFEAAEDNRVFVLWCSAQLAD